MSARDERRTNGHVCRARLVLDVSRKVVVIRVAAFRHERSDSEFADKVIERRNENGRLASTIYTRSVDAGAIRGGRNQFSDTQIRSRDCRLARDKRVAQIQQLSPAAAAAAAAAKHSQRTSCERNTLACPARNSHHSCKMSFAVSRRTRGLVFVDNRVLR